MSREPMPKFEMEPAGEVTITPRATVGESAGELKPNADGSGRPRRKSITTACERCRRRKIKCDGNQPCATCARFSVACVRPSRQRERFGPEAQAALESRVKRLEAQLAETRQHANLDMDAVDDVFSSWPEDNDISPVHPGLRVQTNFNAPHRSYSFDDTMAPYSANSLTSPDIPMIEITGCETPFSRPISPSPSLLSTATSRASTPDPFTVTTPAFHSHLILPKSGPAVSPPMDPHNSSRVWDFGSSDDYAAFLSPTAGAKESHSRRSSISSLGLDQDFSSMNLAFPDYQEAPHGFEQGYSSYGGSIHQSPPTSTPIAHLTPPQILMPQRSDAQQLVEIFFANTDSYDTQLEQSVFLVCMEALYTLPTLHAMANVNTMRHLSSVQLSLGVAKFQVLVVLATALRMIGDPPGSGNAVTSENYYQLAMQQTVSSQFWGEQGGVECALLLSVFAKARAAS